MQSSLVQPIAIGDLDEYLNDLYSYKDERKVCYSEDDLCELRADLASEDRSTAVTVTAKKSTCIKQVLQSVKKPISIKGTPSLAGRPLFKNSPPDYF